jgi:hypothetical protein
MKVVGSENRKMQPTPECEAEGMDGGPKQRNKGIALDWNKT